MAQRTRVSEATVASWLARFAVLRIDGLYDAPRPGRPTKRGAEKVASLIDAALHGQPPDGTIQWSVRLLAKATGIPKSTVQRYIRLQPIRRRYDAG